MGRWWPRRGRNPEDLPGGETPLDLTFTSLDNVLRDLRLGEVSHADAGRMIAGLAVTFAELSGMSPDQIQTTHGSADDRYWAYHRGEGEPVDWVLIRTRR